MLHNMLSFASILLLIHHYAYGFSASKFHFVDVRCKTNLHHMHNKKCLYKSTKAHSTTIKQHGLQDRIICSSNLQALSSRVEEGAAASPNEDTWTKEQEIVVVDASMEYLANLINHRLEEVKNINNDDDNICSSSADDETDEEAATKATAYQLAQGRFIDLTTTIEGEQLLENLFQSLPITNCTTIMNDQSKNTRIIIIQHAISTLQSLLIYGMQIGVKGSEETQKKLVRHLFRSGDPPQESPTGTWIQSWNATSIRRLKFYKDITLGKQLLTRLIRKRTAQGAFDLLVEMGVWDVHVDTALLRSGFPVRFTDNELQVANNEAAASTHDPDDILGIRQDLRNQKVYTIDGPDTVDIDDGISVEVIDDDNTDNDATTTQPTRYRYWIHIADVDRWAPRGSKLLQVAERRGTSLYLPTKTLSMFPESIESVMSLESWEDKYAVSLGVELNATDGTVIPSSIIVTPSVINVQYRLTYDDVDEMLDEGIGYAEEWQIGVLLDAATKRRKHRISQGSTEAMVPCPIPRGEVSARYNDESNGYDISLKIETTHNSGANMSSTEFDYEEHYDPYCSSVSSSQLIVTEMMILAGEAIGKWQSNQPKQDETSVNGCIQLPNALELPFRRQPAPDFKSRETETKQMNFLLEMNKRYPHAWYARRFFNKVNVSEKFGSHFGMGLDCYVQWSSPIRRLTDLQVHSALKRYLRRRRVNTMLQAGLSIPSELTNMDLGYDISNLQSAQSTKDKINAIDPIDYTSGLGMIFAGRPVQSSSSTYWLFKKIQQLTSESEEEVMFESIILGCINRDRFQYSIYVYELGFEHRYVSETGKLEEGQRLWLKVASVNPRLELLTFSLASKSGGMNAKKKQFSAPAA